MAKFKGKAVILIEGNEMRFDVCIDIDDTHIKGNKIETDYEAFRLAKEAALGWSSYEITE